MYSIDLAKSVFQIAGADASGGLVFSKAMRRGQVLGFFARRPAAVIGMEACGSAHYWARELAALGHGTRRAPGGQVPAVDGRRLGYRPQAVFLHNGEQAQRRAPGRLAPRSHSDTRFLETFW
jgi:hypothetical protein